MNRIIPDINFGHDFMNTYGLMIDYTPYIHERKKEYGWHVQQWPSERK